MYDREIEIVGQDFIVFQFRGHSWTLIHQLSQKAALKEQDAEALARQLNTETMKLISTHPQVPQSLEQLPPLPWNDLTLINAIT